MKSVILIAVLLSAVSVHGGTNAEGLKYLEENKDKEGVISLASGMQYKGAYNLAMC